MRALTLLVCLLAAQAHAQDLLPLGASWRYEAFGGWNPGLYGPREMVVQGNITIDTIPCRIVNLYPGGNPLTRFVHADNDRISVYRPETHDFLLLYDFGAQTGDTVYLGPNRKYSIDSTGLLAIGQQELRFQHIRFHPGGLLNDSPYLVLEGIGLVGNVAQDDPQVCSYFFLNESFCDAPVDGQNIYFRCYDNGTLAYDPYGACSLSAEEVTQVTRCRLYPNPAGAVLRLEPGDAGLPHTQYLFDGLGKLVARLETAGSELALPDLPDGRYLARMHFADGGMQTDWVVIVQQP